MCHCPTQISSTDTTGLTEQIESVCDEAATDSEEDVDESLSVHDLAMIESSPSNEIFPEDTIEGTASGTGKCDISSCTVVLRLSSEQ